MKVKKPPKWTSRIDGTTEVLPAERSKLSDAKSISRESLNTLSVKLVSSAWALEASELSERSKLARAVIARRARSLPDEPSDGTKRMKSPAAPEGPADSDV